MKERAKDFSMECPISLSNHAHIQLAHGSGGKLTNQLIEKLFLPAFKNPALEACHDGAVMQIGGSKFAFTTDSYVVHPYFFPGGDIGTLAVNGTVNDLAMCGARPLYLSVGLILEEGFPMENLWRIVQSLRDAALAARVQLVTGDTKVVDKGKGDGIFINTAGIGIVERDVKIAPTQVKSGDAIIISGDIGRHGIAIMAAREGLQFETTIESDTAPLASPVQKLLESGVKVHCCRDLTRGGLATALVEIAKKAHVKICIEEAAISIPEEVKGACEMMGIDPLYVANEGRFIAFVEPRDAVRALKILRQFPVCAEAGIIGVVEDDTTDLVEMKCRIGTRRIVNMLTGEPLPRIC